MCHDFILYEPKWKNLGVKQPLKIIRVLSQIKDVY